jgi:hypothetical protein
MTLSRAEAEAAFGPLNAEYAMRLREVDDAREFILKANEPTVLEQGGFERLSDLSGMSYRDEAGTMLPYLTHDEATCLQIKRGSLTDAERLEINNHVVHTFNFLAAIPWSRTLRSVPDIAHAHHEKLDGSGYPKKLKGDQIPVPARMMAISDIYDALTASDRPYKKAMPAEKALDILAQDVKRGQLDSDLFEVFVGARVWALTNRSS